MKINETEAQAFKGFETWWTSFQMRMKMYVYVGIGLFFVQVVGSILISYLRYRSAWSAWLEYTWAVLVGMRWSEVVNVSWPYLIELLKRSWWIFLSSFWLWILYPIAIGKFKKKAEKVVEERHIRGARLIEPKELIRQIKKNGEKVDIPLGSDSVRMPVRAEPQHMFVIGRPGVGKTVALMQVLERIRERNEKALIYDFKGDYLAKFYDPQKDIIFNPLDTRCLGWSVFREIETYMDIDSVATSLIPPAVSQTADPFWNEAAKDVFAGILHYLWQVGGRTNADIWEMVTAPAEEIARRLMSTKGGERGYRYIEDPSSKQAMSVLSVMMQHVKSFEYMADGSFSIKEWLESDQRGFIFVTSYADIQDTLRPILSLFIDLMGRKLLSMRDDYHRRVFIFIDEFGTLQRLPTIVKLLTLSRSKGGSVWIGVQDIGQIERVYTPHLRQAIINACGSSLIFSVSDPETAEFLSRKIGEREYSEVEETHGMGPEDMRDGISLVRRKKRDRLILPSELQGLPDLMALLKLPGYNLTKVRLQYKHYPDRVESFICRPDLNLENIIAEQKAVQEAEQKEVENVREEAKEAQGKEVGEVEIY